MKASWKSIIAGVVGLLLLTQTAIAQSFESSAERITLRVDGLSCPFCAYGLEKKLKSFQGVSNLDIKVNDGLAAMDVRPGTMLTDEQLKKAVRDAGFTLRSIKRELLPTSSIKDEEKMEIIKLNVQGMTCSGCVYNVETALKSIPAVHSVDVSLENHSVTVRAEPGKVEAAELIEKIQKAGKYKASEHTD